VELAAETYPLTGKNAIVTGAGNGIGKALAPGLASTEATGSAPVMIARYLEMYRWFGLVNRQSLSDLCCFCCLMRQVMCPASCCRWTAAI
tara:strand:+ start:205 stop:474 length:270 start_codon:yes stop_codon:yes gene_type:complete